MHFLWTLLFLSSSLWAHQTSLTSSGNALYWPSGSVPVQITTNTADMSSDTAKAIIRNSMNEWNGAGNVARVTEVGSSSNEIRFVSNFPYGSAVLGVTEISYGMSGGIQKAVISLNDDYQFKSTPGIYPTGQVFLGDVVTHELGHLFGLSHSEVLNATMFYSAFSGQSTIAFDDKSGLRQKYDSGFGQIYGKVQGGNHIGILGVQVQAISRSTGEASSAITDENGNFTLGGLDLNDTYYLYTAPIKNANSLPGYFSNYQTDFCPSTYKGSFFSACGRENDGKPQGITLTSQQSVVNVGTVTVNCSLRVDESYTYEKLQSTFAPVTIYDYREDQKLEKSFVGFFRKRTDTNWSSSDILRIDLTNLNFSGTNKYLKVSLVSYPFGARLEYRMTAQMNGVPIPEVNRAMSYSSVTETYNPDLEFMLPLNGDINKNNFELSISARKLDTYYLAQTFPSANEFTSDEHLPYLVVASVWEYSGGSFKPLIDSGVNLSDNEACLDAPFTYAVAKTQDSTKESTTNGDQTVAATGCGTIEPPKSGPGSSLPLLVLGFMMAMAPSILGKSRKKFLS